MVNKQALEYKIHIILVWKTLYLIKNDYYNFQTNSTL